MTLFILKDTTMPSVFNRSFSSPQLTVFKPATVGI